MVHKAEYKPKEGVPCIVAVKRLKDNLLVSKDDVTNFLKEVALLRKLRGRYEVLASCGADRTARHHHHHYHHHWRKLAQHAPLYAPHASDNEPHNPLCPLHTIPYAPYTPTAYAP